MLSRPYCHPEQSGACKASSTNGVKTIAATNRGASEGSNQGDRVLAFAALDIRGGAASLESDDVAALTTTSGDQSCSCRNSNGVVTSITGNESTVVYGEAGSTCKADAVVAIQTLKVGLVGEDSSTKSDCVTTFTAVNGGLGGSVNVDEN